MFNISKSGLLDIQWHTMATQAPVGANKENRKKGGEIIFLSHSIRSLLHQQAHLIRMASFIA